MSFTEGHSFLHSDMVRTTNHRTTKINDLPQAVVCSPPHLQVLFLGPGPEVDKIRLIPDINRQALGSMIGVHIRDPLCEIVIPRGPISIVSWIWRAGVLASIGSPKVVNQENESGIVLSGCFVIRQGRSKSILIN